MERPHFAIFGIFRRLLDLRRWSQEGKPSMEVKMDLEGLSVKQENLLRRMRTLEVPPMPAPDPALLLQDRPLRYRVLSLGARRLALLLIVLLIGGILFYGMARVPQVWQGVVPFRSGSVAQLLTEGRQTIRLPGGQGTLILEGPAILQMNQLSRNLLSGRCEAKLLLQQGDLFLQARAGRPKLIQIQTPLLTLQVTGTQLWVGHRPELGSRIMVLEGEVQVKAGHSTWQPLPARVELTVSPEGRIRRRDLSGQEPSVWEDTPLSTPSDGAAGSDSRSNQRLLWHEEGSQ